LSCSVKWSWLPWFILCSLESLWSGFIFKGKLARATKASLSASLTHITVLQELRNRHRASCRCLYIARLKN
jgi:hypothetical protein